MSPDEKKQDRDPALTDDDRHRLESLDRKLQLVRDRTAGVAKGLHTGLHIYGDPGIGKSFTVVEELGRLRVPFRLTNSRITGRGLFDLLARQPEEIHVLDDVEPLTRDLNGVGLLRAALWGQEHRNRQGRLERQITWSVHREPMSAVFSGGIIMIGNRPLEAIPELEALKSRIATVHLQASDLEVAAMMRAIALEGRSTAGRSLSAAERSEVAEYIIKEPRGLGRPLNLRLLENGLADVQQWSDFDSGCHWTDLISSRLRERPTIMAPTVSVGIREMRRREELQIAREIADLPQDERLELWQQQTGKSRSAMYRRLTELGETDDSHFREG